MAGTMTYEELCKLVGPRLAAAHLRKVAAMRLFGVHPSQVFSWRRKESCDAD